MSSRLKINCLVLGDKPSHVFTVQIAKTKNISTLKELIKDKKKHALGNIDANTLVLWHVSIPVHEIEDNPSDFDLKQSLLPVKTLSEVFPEPPPEDNVHIFVRSPHYVVPSPAIGSKAIGIWTKYRRPKVLAVYLVLLTIVLVPWIVVFALTLKGGTRDDQPPYHSIKGTNQITMEVELVGLDLEGRDMQVLWFPLDYHGCYVENIPDVEFYMDSSWEAGQDTSSNGTLSNNDSNVPIFYLNMKTFCNLTDTRPDWPVFQTNLKVLPWILKNLVNVSDGQGDGYYLDYATGPTSEGDYPFDQYHVNMYLFAREAPSQNPVPIKITHTGLVLSGFRMSTREFQTYPNPDALFWSVKIQRSYPVQIYAILVSIAIAAVSIMFFVIAMGCWIFGYKQEVQLLVLPVASFFAFTQLRQTLPNLPAGTGTLLDYYVNLPALILLSISTLVSIYLIAMQKHGHRRTPVRQWVGPYTAGRSLEAV